MLVIKEPKAQQLLIEIANRLDRLEVKGDSVEHLFRIKMAYKSIVESIDEVQILEQPIEKEAVEKEE